MVLLTRDETEKYRSLKTQLVLSSTNQNEKVKDEPVCRKNGFFFDKKADFNIFKKALTSLSTLIMATYLLSRVVRQQFISLIL